MSSTSTQPLLVAPCGCCHCCCHWSSHQHQLLPLLVAVEPCMLHTLDVPRTSSRHHRKMTCWRHLQDTAPNAEGQQHAQCTDVLVVNSHLTPHMWGLHSTAGALVVLILLQKNGQTPLPEHKLQQKQHQLPTLNRTETAVTFNRHSSSFQEHHSTAQSQLHVTVQLLVVSKAWQPLSLCSVQVLSL